MRRMALRQASLYTLLLSCALTPPAAGQGRGRVKQKQPAEVSPVAGADSLNNLKFRNLGPSVAGGRVAAVVGVPGDRDRKSTRLNSSHDQISYAVFCLKKKKKK